MATSLHKLRLRVQVQRQNTETSSSFSVEVQCILQAATVTQISFLKAKICFSLTFTTLLANSADNKLVMFFSYFSQETGFAISSKLSPLETICMKWQNLFYGKTKKKYFNMLPAENFTQSAKS